MLILDCPYRASMCLPNHSMYPGNFYCSGIICTFTKEESLNIKMLKRTFRKSMLLLRDCYLILILYGCIYGVTTNNRFITAVIIFPEWKLIFKIVYREYTILLNYIYTCNACMVILRDYTWTI